MRVRCSGYIMSNDNAGIYRHYGYQEVICPDDIRNAITSNPAGEDLIFEINSGGGSLYHGMEMYSLVRGASCNTVAEVQSLAGSAATLLMAGCRDVAMSPVAQLMIHLPTVATKGDRWAHKASLSMLDSGADGILEAYALRCKGKASREQLARMMNKTTFFSARQAVEIGLADRILEDVEPLPENVVNAIGDCLRGVFSGPALPPIDELRALFQAEHGKPDWWEAARAELENNRFL